MGPGATRTLGTATPPGTGDAVLVFSDGRSCGERIYRTAVATRAKGWVAARMLLLEVRANPRGDPAAGVRPDMPNSRGAFQRNVGVGQ